MSPIASGCCPAWPRTAISSEFAEQIYKQILGFGEYGFPESHAASFALLTYISSWLKCHEPAAFAAALINSQPMGFYAPAQITQDVRRSGVDGAGRSMSASATGTARSNPATLPRRPLHRQQPALRLGLRLVRGLPRADAERIVAERARQRFASIDELAARAQLSRRSIQALAAAGALARLERAPARRQLAGAGRRTAAGLIAGLSASEPPAALPAPTESQNILADYRHLGLTTGRHPLALLRPALIAQGLSQQQRSAALADGSSVRVGGLVTHMQQPATASGVVFASLEDETGIVNIILWPKVFAAQRRCALESSLLVVEGTLQRRDRVAHVIAQRLHNRSAWLGGMRRDSRDFH